MKKIIKVEQTLFGINFLWQIVEKIVGHFFEDRTKRHRHMRRKRKTDCVHQIRFKHMVVHQYLQYI